MCKLFDELKDQIEKYCRDNNLSFNAAQKMSQSWNRNTVALYHYDSADGSMGLLDDRPCPMVLLITKGQNGKVHFEQTEYTQKYLGKAS